MVDMKIVIETGLPPDGLALSIAKELQSQHPWLVALFAGRRATETDWLWQQQGCSPKEGLQLQLAQCPIPFGQPLAQSFGSALGPYLANITDPEQTVWLADMCHTAISQDRAALVALPDLLVSQKESDALWASAAPLFDGSGENDGFTLDVLDIGRARIMGKLPPAAKVISPMALSGQDLGDWWPTGADWRAWRRLLNELQMVWHEHPVNEAREAAGQMPINGVWLYGGAVGWQPSPSGEVLWRDDLKAASHAGDWHQWIQSWQGLHDTLLSADPETPIVLLGHDRWVTLQHAPKTWWRSLLGNRSKHAWTNWWARQ